MNLPPHIATDFVSPAQDVLLVESSQPVGLAVESLIDPNPEEKLYYAFIGDRSGLIEQATVTRQPTENRYRDAFYLFERVEIEVDPCAERLRNHDHELVRLFVADRPFERVTEAEVEPSQGGFVTSHRWLLRLAPQICP